MQPNRHTRSLILDDRLWDELHAAYLQAQLATPGERLSKTDFVERVMRRGIEAVRRSRTASRTVAPEDTQRAAEPQQVGVEPAATPAPPPKVEQPAVTPRSRGVERLRRMAAGGNPGAIRSAADVEPSQA